MFVIYIKFSIKVELCDALVTISLKITTRITTKKDIENALHQGIIDILDPSIYASTAKLVEINPFCPSLFHKNHKNGSNCHLQQYNIVNNWQENN